MLITAEQPKIGSSMLNITYQERKTDIGKQEKTNVTDVTDQSEDGYGPWQGPSAEYHITDGHQYHHLDILRRKKT